MKTSMWTLQGIVPIPDTVASKCPGMLWFCSPHKLVTLLCMAQVLVLRKIASKHRARPFYMKRTHCEEEGNCI